MRAGSKLRVGLSFQERTRAGAECGSGCARSIEETTNGTGVKHSKPRAINRQEVTGEREREAHKKHAIGHCKEQVASFPTSMEL